MDYDERNKTITQGVWAEGLQQDEIFKEVLEQQYDETFAKMMMTDSKATEERESFYWMMRGLQEFEVSLQRLVDAKKMIEKQEAEQEEKRGQ